MLETDLSNLSEQLANFIRQKKFQPITQRTPYYHMGATITDSILQAGLNYRNVVYPRVLNLLTKYGDYRTTCDFLILMEVVPLTELIAWRNEKKLKCIIDLSWTLFNNGIENENHLAAWLDIERNTNQIRSISGIGPKTIDYLKMLSGKQSIAIDRHLFAFLELAGIFNLTYSEASLIYGKASKLLGMSKYELDRKIWLYMSEPI
ncbi:MAG: hypothetical protein RBT15_04210 [Gudongella sp.]|nr:hypothetical protein [Gudongella sp.]